MIDDIPDFNKKCLLYFRCILFKLIIQHPHFFEAIKLHYKNLMESKTDTHPIHSSKIYGIWKFYLQKNEVDWLGGTRKKNIVQMKNSLVENHIYAKLFSTRMSITQAIKSVYASFIKCKYIYVNFEKRIASEEIQTVYNLTNDTEL